MGKENSNHAEAAYAIYRESALEEGVTELCDIDTFKEQMKLLYGENWEEERLAIKIS